MAEEQGFNALAREHTSSPDAGVDNILAELTKEDTPRDEQGKFIKAEQNTEAAADEAAPEESEPVEAEAETDEDAAPDEDQPSGDEEEQDTEPDDSPPIEMPVSWSAEDAETWQALTPAAQAKVLERETARDTEVRRVQNETAEKRKAAEAEATAAQTERQQLAQALTQVNAYGNTLDPIIQRGAQTDWAQLARDEGADEAMAQKAEYDQRVEYYQAVGQELQRLQQYQRQQHKKTQISALREKLPDMADDAKASAFKEAAQPVLQDAGYSTEEINALWSEMPDHRHVSILKDAVEYRKLKAQQKAIVEKKAADKASKVIKPKAQQNPTDQNKTRVDALRKQVRQDPRTVDIDQLTALAQQTVRN